jgi:hypothetical protein
MTAIVTGHANLGIAAKQFARLTNIAIALPHMHTVGFQPLRKGNTVIDDERNVMRSANGLQWFRKCRRLMLIYIFDPKLESRDGASG